MKRVHVFISGEVTGVLFRAFVKENAGKLKIKGWVKNVGENVEGVFEGKNKDVDLLIEMCKNGPEAARVDNIDVNEERYSGEFNNFDIVY